MKWAFIDYENVGCLSKIDLSTYEKVIIFIGAKQPKLDFGEKKYESPINLVLIQIKVTQANNLDFHLSYYLGKFDHEAHANVAFDVITNDNGFSPLIAHIKSNGRGCKQIKLANSTAHIKSNDDGCKQVKLANPTGELIKLIHSLKSKPKEKRPQKVLSLRNYIASHMKAKGNEVAIQNFLNHLVNQNILSVSERGVQYKC